MKEFYTGKTIFISGCTGFLAKIILEKLIRTVSDFKKIYVLIRRKQGTTLQSRMQREIYDSQLFKILFEKQPELIALVKERVIPVQGDLLAEELGMDPKQRMILQQDVEIIINSAASVDMGGSIHEML